MLCGFRYVGSHTYLISFSSFLICFSIGKDAICASLFCTASCAAWSSDTVNWSDHCFAFGITEDIDWSCFLIATICCASARVCVLIADKLPVFSASFKEVTASVSTVKSLYFDVTAMTLLAVFLICCCFFAMTCASTRVSALMIAVSPDFTAASSATVSRPKSAKRVVAVLSTFCAVFLMRSMRIRSASAAFFSAAMRSWRSCHFRRIASSCSGVRFAWRCSAISSGVSCFFGFNMSCTALKLFRTKYGSVPMSCDASILSSLSRTHSLKFSGYCVMRFPRGLYSLPSSIASFIFCISSSSIRIGVTKQKHWGCQPSKTKFGG